MNRDQLIQSTDIVEVIRQRLPDLKRKGAEWVACCPFHSDNTPSLSVNPKKRIFKCFGCGEGGNAIDFVMKHERLTFIEAFRKLGGKPKERTAPEPQPERIQDPQLLPPPDSVPDFNHSKYGQPVAVWAYHNANGQTVGYVARYQGPDRKEIIPYTYRSKGWVSKGFDDPRPLYRLPEVLWRQDYKSVLLVEGEKAADAAARLFPTMAVVSWNGGTGAVLKSDWSVLAGKRVVLFPDNDLTQAYPNTHDKAGQVKPFYEQPGPKAMHQIADKLLEFEGVTLYWAQAPDGFTDKWDWADFTGTPEEASNIMQSTIRPYSPPPVDLDSYQQKPEPSQQDLTRQTAPPELIAEPLTLDTPTHFRALGYAHNASGFVDFYFYSFFGKQVYRFSASSMTASNLLVLEKMSFWEMHFPGKTGASYTKAAEWLQDECWKQGVYDPDNERGIGTWLDDGRIVVHAGNKLFVDGKETDLTAIGSRYIYEAGKPLRLSVANPLSTQEAQESFHLISSLSWMNRVNPYLFLGWCVIAPVCGALYWRPHMWLTGEAGSGKTTAVKIAKYLLGNTAISADSKTSEPGVRQAIGCNARPVVFDETDGESKNDFERIQNILALARGASAHDGAEILKGDQSGAGKVYRIRSCFMFAGIAPQATNQADISRIAVLSMVRRKDFQRDAWEELQKSILNLFTEGYCERFRARAIKMVPIILENAKVLSSAAAVVFGEQRSGDQYGTLLAGAYSVFSDDIISYESAKTWLETMDWNDVRPAERTEDHVELLNFILQQRETVESNGARFERTIIELIDIVYNGLEDRNSPITKDAADKKLQRLGMRIKDGKLYISNSHDPIKRMLANSIWPKNHARMLKRIEGAQEEGSVRFGAMVARAVSIPMERILEHAPRVFGYETVPF